MATVERRSLEQVNAAALRQIFTDHFNDGELRNLCQDLNIDYESLPGHGKADKARELVAYVRRYGRATELVAWGRHHRLDVDWRGIIVPSGPPDLESSRATSPVESAPISSARVIVHLERKLNEFTPTAQQSFVQALSILVNVTADQIRIIHLGPGSVKLTLAIPVDSANTLVSLHLNDDAELQRLGVWKVVYLQPPFVILLFNALIAAAFAYFISGWISIPCTSWETIALGCGVISLVGLHSLWRLVWHNFPMLIRALTGNFALGWFKIPFRLLIQFFDELHPWFLNAHVAAAVALALVVLSLIPSMAIRNQSTRPLLRGFEVQHPDGTTMFVKAGDRFNLTTEQSIVVKMLFLEPTDVHCTWSATQGFTSPAKECSTIYTPPFQGELDNLIVHINAVCSEFEIFSDLNLSIVRT
jgi:hypothetical protein